MLQTGHPLPPLSRQPFPRCSSIGAMSHWIQSSHGSTTSNRMHGQSSSRTTDWLSDLVGEETSLPLVICPCYKLARVIERRSMKENPSLGHVYFRCQRNGVSFLFVTSSAITIAMLGLVFLNKFVQYSKLCGYYVWQQQYLKDLKKSGMIQVRLMDSEDEEEEGSEGHFFVVFWLLELESCIMLY